MLPQTFGTAAVRIALTSLIVCAFLTFLVRALARRRGLVAAPKKDRWHQKPTAMMGGVAIFAATLVFLAFVPQTPASTGTVFTAVNTSNAISLTI